MYKAYLETFKQERDTFDLNKYRETKEDKDDLLDIIKDKAHDDDDLSNLINDKAHDEDDLSNLINDKTHDDDDLSDIVKDKAHDEDDEVTHNVKDSIYEEGDDILHNDILDEDGLSSYDIKDKDEDGNLSNLIKDKAHDDDDLSNLINDKTHDEDDLSNLIKDKAHDEDDLSNLIKDKTHDDDDLSDIIKDKAQGKDDASHRTKENNDELSKMVQDIIDDETNVDKDKSELSEDVSRIVSSSESENNSNLSKIISSDGSKPKSSSSDGSKPKPSSDSSKPKPKSSSSDGSKPKSSKISSSDANRPRSENIFIVDAPTEETTTKSSSRKGNSSPKSSKSRPSSPKPKGNKSENKTEDSESSSNSTPSDIEIANELESLIDSLAGGAVSELVIDESKKNIIVVQGFVSQEIYDLLRSEHLIYIDLSKEEPEAYNKVMGSLDNKYIGKEKKSKLITEEMYNNFMKKDIKVGIIRLTNQQYDILSLISMFTKNKDVSVSFISYSYDYMVQESKRRLRKQIYSKPSSWLFYPLKTFFTKAKKGSKESGLITINKSELTKELQNWKMFYESEKEVTDEVTELMGKDSEAVFVPAFKFDALVIA